MPGLRNYQLIVIDNVNAEIAAGNCRVLLVAPTGSGKTVIAGKLIGDNVKAGKRVLFLAHRRELIKQASNKLHAVGIDHGIMQAGFKGRQSPVQVGSVQTIHARAVRSSRMAMPDADLVVIDEAHHVRARTYQQIIENYPEAVIVGLTATPARGDGRGLGDDFNVIVECPQIPELILGGHLVSTRVYAPTIPDLHGVHIRHGDYVESELAERMDKKQLVGDIVMHWLKLARDRKTVIFATSVSHSVNIRDEFRRAGIMAEHLDGTTPMEERDGILSRLVNGKIEVVTNCMVLTEGWDCPDVACCVLARPTKSMLLYRQMIGRILRPAPGKTDALILDHAGAIFEHGFVEEPVEWFLSPDRKARNEKQEARGLHRTPGLKPCPECHAIRVAGQPCGACGWMPKPKAAPVDVIDGDLGEVNRRRIVTPAYETQVERDRFYQELLWVARDRGYKPGWAAYKYKEKFGGWPSKRFLIPVEPSDEVRRWVRSRQIAYAKSQQASGAAK